MLGFALSGGASKGAFTAGCARYLLRDMGLDFKVAVGTSTGSLVGGPALLGDYNYLRDLYVSVEDKDIFLNSLIGTILNTIGVMQGPIDARMSPLHNLLKDYYLTNHKLDAILETDKKLVVSAINARTGNVIFVSSELVRSGAIAQENFVKAILASCSEPFFTKPVQVFEGVADPPFDDVEPTDLFWDGGIKEFIPIEHCAALGADEIWAISTHPMVNEHSDIRAQDGHWPNIADAIGWTLGSLLDEVARGDRFRASLYNRWSRVRGEIVQRAEAAGLTAADAANLVQFDPDDDLLYGLSIDKLHMIAPEKHMHTSLKFEPARMWGYYNAGFVRTRSLCEAGDTLYDDDSLRPWYLPE